MPNWKKLVVSGSNAHLNSLDVNTFVSASEFVGGNFQGDGSQLTNVTASYLTNELTASISGSITAFSSSIVSRVENLEVTGSDHETRLDTAEISISSLNNATSSYALKTEISGAFASDSSSFEQRITSNESSISSLNAATSSYLLNTTDTLTGDLTVTGKITAQEFHTEFVSASILYQSGSTKFGDTSDDVHSFTGSVNISGSITADNLVGIISSSAQIADEISGSFTDLSSSLEGRVTTLEGSVSSLNAATSSYALEANISGAFTSVSQSIAADIEDIIDGTTTVASSSYALTASYALNAGGGTGVGFPFSGSAIITGSLYVSQSTISGSFVGDGSGIEGVVSSSYALTASYALNAGGADTGSLLATASAAGSTITFEKGDGSTFDVVVSSEVTPANALVTASLDGSTLTFEKGDTSTFDIILPAGGYSGSNATAHLNQTVAATTWSFGHNLDDRYPVFTVFDNNGDIIVPNRVETVDNNNANIYFTTARTGTATAVIASSISQISSITSDFTNETTVAVTHSLDTRNIHVSVYDENYALIIPESIVLDTLDTVVVTFPVAKSGTVVVAKGGHIISGSAATAISSSYILSSGVDGPLGMDSITSASYALTASYAESFTATSVTASAFSAEYIDFNTSPTVTPVEGRLVWNADDGTLDLGLANATLQIGQEQYWYVRNNTASPIPNGAGVMATGTLGASTRITAAPMIADGTVPAKFFLGVATEEIAAGADGYVTTFGKVRGIDTSLIPSGSVLWCDPDNPGGLTVDEPIAPNLKLPVAFVVSQKNNGSIAVRATTGVRLSNSHDVQITSASHGELLMRSGSIWINSSQLSGSYGLTGSLTADSFVGPLTGTASYASNANLLDGLNSTQFLRSDQTGTLTGDLTVTGTLTAQEFHTEFVSASIIYQSGSTKFGNSADDIHSFTGSIKVDGDITGSFNPTGHLLPSTTNLYDLGSPSQQWRDLYLSSASLYVDGVKIISSDANVLTFTTDVGQSIKILEAGSDDITLQTENGNIELKGTVEITSGKKIIDSAGTVIQFGDSLGVTGSIITSGTVNGIDLQDFSSSLETRVSDLELFSQSLDSTFATDQEVADAVSALNAATSSYALEANISGAFDNVSQSIATDIANIVDGTTQVPSASLAQTASYIDPTFISASAAAEGFGQGGVTSIIAGTGISVDQSTGDVTITATGGGGTGEGFPYVGDAVITGSLLVSGSFISGSFKGDGSQLTGIDVGAVASVSDTFTSQTQVVVTHNFNSKDVNVAVYNSSDEYIIPDNITLTNFNTVTVDFAVPTSGRIVVSKGGHILSGIGLNTKAGSIATSSFSATGSSFYYDVVFDAPFASTNYTVGLQAHSQFSVPDSFPGHAWVDSDKATTGFRIVVPSFDSTMDEIAWTAVAHGESNVTASNANTASYVDYSNVANKPTLISSSLQFNTLTTPFTGSFTGSFYGDGSNLSGVTSYTDADTLSFIQGYSGSYSGSFIGDGSQLSGVTSYTDADTLAYINSLAVVSGSSITGSFTGSFFGDGTGLTGLGYGDTKKLNQAVAATTWSFNHNMNEQYPTVTVYNTSNEVIQPSKIEAVSSSTLNLYFGIPTAGTAVAVVGGVALTQEAGFNRTLSQTVAATTWSFAHNLGQKYPQITVYDVNDELIIPGKVEAVDQNNAILYFDTAQAGTVAATVGGTAMTASYSDTLTVVDTLLSSQKNTDVDTGTETVATVSTSLYDGAFFDYVIKDGTNYRAGTVMAVWDGTSVQYSDNSTSDIGDTSGVTLAVDISGTDARLRATVSSDNWNIKAFVRAL